MVFAIKMAVQMSEKKVSLCLYGDFVFSIKLQAVQISYLVQNFSCDLFYLKNVSVVENVKMSLLL